MRISPARRRAAKGVATIEVLVAVAIVLMVGAIGIVSFGNTAKGTVREQAAEAALFLQQTRLHAQELGRPVEIIVSANDRHIQAGGMTHEFSGDIEIAPKDARLVLQPTGGSEGLALTLSKDNQSAEVTLDWLTGKVAVK